MPLRPPRLRVPARTVNETRPTRPSVSRTAPLRQPLEAAPARPTNDATSASVGEQAVASAYQIFDRYLEEGRQYASGQSAWSQRAANGSAPSSPTSLAELRDQGQRVLSAIDALRSDPNLGRVAPWLELVARVIPVVAAELSRTIGSPAAQVDGSQGDDWQRWFQGQSPPSEDGSASTSAGHRAHGTRDRERQEPRRSTIPLGDVKGPVHITMDGLRRGPKKSAVLFDRAHGDAAGVAKKSPT